MQQEAESRFAWMWFHFLSNVWPIGGVVAPPRPLLFSVKYLLLDTDDASAAPALIGCWPKRKRKRNVGTFQRCIQVSRQQKALSFHLVHARTHTNTLTHCWSKPVWPFQNESFDRWDQVLLLKFCVSLSSNLHFKQNFHTILVCVFAGTFVGSGHLLLLNINDARDLSLPLNASCFLSLHVHWLLKPDLVPVSTSLWRCSGDSTGLLPVHRLGRVHWWEQPWGSHWGGDPRYRLLRGNDCPDKNCKGVS